MSNVNNPFTSLLQSQESTSNQNNDTNQNSISRDALKIDENIELVNEVIENVFLFTINPKASEKTVKSKQQLVYLEELAASLKQKTLMDLEELEQGLFERLLLINPESAVTPKNSTILQEHVVQKLVFPYLFKSFLNLKTYELSNDRTIIAVVKKMKELIFRNAVTALKQPALFENQDFTKQLVDLLKDENSENYTFFANTIQEFTIEGTEEMWQQLKDTMFPVLRAIHLEVADSNVINLPIYILPAIQAFASNPHLGPILLESCKPHAESQGRLYRNSVIGALLNLSCLPDTLAHQHQFFDNPLDQAALYLAEKNINNATSHLTRSLHKIFLSLLKGGTELRNDTLKWIANCLKANEARGKLWNIQGDAFSPALMNSVSDGFMINLGAVLLHLCQPFCTRPDDPKALKIDPTYGAVPPEECEAKSVHLDCLHKETCLLPPNLEDNGQPMKRPVAESYNFVTECFFLTQRCLDLGVRVCAEKLWKIGQEVGRAQRALADATNAGAQHLLEPLRQSTKLTLTKYVAIRCALLETEMITNLQRLQAMTCTWLVQVAVNSNPVSPQQSYAPPSYIPIELPINSPPPDTLRCIPEFILENIVVLISISRRIMINESSEATTLLQPAFTLVLMFMGDSGRINNPHVRARLAECLEAMLPTHPEEQTLNEISVFYRDQLFKEHPHRHQVVSCLLDVFVGIEMTGQSVQFEQKFNYRRPMYIVMHFLWDLEEHRNAFTKLAREAEANMEAVKPPIFLRFVNLLMNDAIFLLDEALGNMAQIRTMQSAQESGMWANLPAQEREQNIANLSHTGMLARFDNILGRDTIKTLVNLTDHAPYVFCHPTLVDRIASMLNYFLLHLVGPNKKNFKVKDLKQFEFDPASTVLDICRMYVVLGANERFCAAVSDDGRSYSSQLFSQAETVLVRIGGGPLIGALGEFAARVASTAERRQREEELLANAPDEFLDPIMSTVMLDPVVLPSSRITVDRTTIARHLLSDQTDPFNRSPLSMDQVKSDVELKERVHSWIAKQKEEAAGSST